MGHLGHGEEEGEEVRQPEIVGGHQEVLVSLHLLGVHIAPGGPALQVFSHIGGAVDPTVGTAGRKILLSTETQQSALSTLTERIWEAGRRSGR